MKYLIVGGGLAGLRAAEAIRELDATGSVVLLGAEAEAPYSRPPLSKEYLVDSGAELALTTSEALLEAGVEFHRLSAATRLHLSARAVELATGERLSFDRLLIATGATPRRLRVPGADREGVLYLRTRADADALSVALRRAADVVVVGAGLVGLEIASVARALGRRVTVLEAGARPLTRMLGPELGAPVVTLLEAAGVTVRLGVQVREVLGSEAVEALLLSDGTRIDAQLVVVAIGVEPQVDWLRGSGVRLDDGVVVNELGETRVPGIYAAGDVARAWTPPYAQYLRPESYAVAQSMGTAVGRTMAGTPTPIFWVPSASWSQFGVRLQVAGLWGGAGAVVTRGSRDSESFSSLLIQDGRVAAVFSMGRPREFGVLRRLVNRPVPWASRQFEDESFGLAGPQL